MENNLIRWWAVSPIKTLQTCNSSLNGLSTVSAKKLLKQYGAFSLRSVPSYKLALINYRVLRDGVTKTVPFNELVFGDIVLCQKGDLVPAQMRLIKAKNLVVQEQNINGVAAPSYKNTFTLKKELNNGATAPNMMYGETYVISGNGIGVIVEKPNKSPIIIRISNKFAKNGLIMAKSTEQKLKSTNLVIFDGLSSPSQVIDSVQFVAINKQIKCLYFLDHNLAIECGTILPEANANKTNTSSLISFFDTSLANKNKVVTALSQQFNTLYIYSGSQYELAASIANCDIVFKDQASPESIIKAKIIASNLTVSRLASFLYNNI